MMVWGKKWGRIEGICIQNKADYETPASNSERRREFGRKEERRGMRKGKVLIILHVPNSSGN